MLTQESGQFEYPAGENVYMSRKNCAWVIKTNSMKVLNITITNFNIGTSGSCRYDWVQMHDGSNTVAPLIGRFCGNTPPLNGTVITNTHSLYIWYRRDDNAAKSNDKMSLTWSSINPICGGEISVKSHGVIKSPGFPGNYPKNRYCSSYPNYILLPF